MSPENPNCQAAIYSHYVVQGLEVVAKFIEEMHGF